MYEKTEQSIASQIEDGRCGCPTCYCKPCACESGRCGSGGGRPVGRRVSTVRKGGTSPKRTLQRIGSLAALLAAISAHRAAAQVISQDGVGTSVGIALTQMRPVGSLGANIGSGYGVFGAFLLPLDHRGLLSPRADLGIPEYGHDKKRTPFSQTVGGRVEVDVRTTHAVVPGSIGIQVTPAFGPVEPYINAGVGAQAFFTESRAESTGDGSVLASTTNHSDFALAWTLGGGVYVPVASRLPDVLLDISVQYFHGARAEYLAPGSIVDLDGGRIAISPLESTTHFLALRVGAGVRL
jgi:opacity protein-like surface antigen